MDYTALATAIGQLGFALAAYRLAIALKTRVDNHEGRLGVLERRGKIKVLK